MFLVTNSRRETAGKSVKNPDSAAALIRVEKEQKKKKNDRYNSKSQMYRVARDYRWPCLQCGLTLGQSPGEPYWNARSLHR